MDLRPAHILLKNRLQPHSTTGVSPTELLIGRKPRTHFDLLHLDLSRVKENQISQRHVNQLEYRFVEDSTPVGDVVPVTCPSVISPAPDLLMIISLNQNCGGPLETGVLLTDTQVKF